MIEADERSGFRHSVTLYNRVAQALEKFSVSGERAAPPEMNAQNFHPKRRWMRRNIQARRRNFGRWRGERARKPIGFAARCKVRRMPLRSKSSMCGTVISAVARSRFTVRITSMAFGDGSKTTAAPSSGGTNNAMNWPKTWLRGTEPRSAGGEATARTCDTGDPALERLEICQEIAVSQNDATRFAVVPEVNRICAMWSRMIGSSARD